MSEASTKSELFEFDSQPVIKGYPELRWTGKRPYRSTQYYPAQLKESFGEPKDGWMNKIFWGDNLQVMSHMLKEYRGTVDLIYIDPPFDSKADYKKKIALRGKSVLSDASAFEEKQYGDIWGSDEYLQYMFERLILLKELLSGSGSIYLHCDYHRSHHLRMLMDEVFGPSCFKSEIVWKRSTAHSDSSGFANLHDVIFYYALGNDYYFEVPYMPYTEEYINTRYKHVDADGRRYLDRDLSAKGLSGGGYSYSWNGKPGYWRCPEETMQRYEAENRIYYTKNGTPRYKQYMDEMPGMPVQDLWTDIFAVNSQALERLDYPTQKPEDLLKRIIQASTKPGDLVFDCFMGSGTTQAVAMKLGRRFLGADINLGSVQTTTKRLVGIAKELSGQLDSEDKYLGFEIYNVNNYDFFRNPVEAKELLTQALDIQPFTTTDGIFDGELDGRMVKILPTNRIATKADMEGLLANLPYADYDDRKMENPNTAVDHITLVCMGHEPDLKAAILQELDEYVIDIEIVDILRDKKELEFKREAEADITVADGKLIIKSFYPLNLLQKLSLQKEAVGEWRELVESVMIDWNYDGAVMEPSIIDIPGKNEMVAGVYDVPEDAGTIKVKITDVLSESLEVEVH